MPSKGLSTLNPSSNISAPWLERLWESELKMRAIYKGQVMEIPVFRTIPVLPDKHKELRWCNVGLVFLTICYCMLVSL